MSYQWYKSINGGKTWNKTYFDGSRTEKLSIITEKYMDGYCFKCEVKLDDNSIIVSEPAKIIITKAPIIIIKQPQNFIKEKDENAVFNIEIKGSIKSYQWYKSIDGGDNWAKTYFDGATTSSLSVPVQAYMNGYLFKCIIVGQNDERVESDSAAIIIPEASIIKQPMDLYVLPGETADVSITVSGDIKAYQWYKSVDVGISWSKTFFKGYNTETLSINV